MSVTEPVKVKRLTEYHVLERREQGMDEVWILRQENVPAISAGQAIKQLGDLKNEAMYVAVPSRSFNPLKVTLETKTQLKLG